MINYGLNKNDKLLNSEVYSEQTFSEEQTIRNSTDNLNSDNISHTLFTNFKYKPDSKTTIVFSPSFNLDNSTRMSERQEILQLFSNGKERSPQVQNSNSINNGKDHRISGRIMVNRKLDTAGRNIIFTANLGSSGSIGDESQQNQLSFVDLSSGIQRDSLQSQQIYSENNALSAAFKLTYTEPIGKKSKLDLTLNQSLSQNHSDRSVYDAFDDSFIDSLSNFTRYKFVESSMEVSYRYQEKKFNYTLGLSGINSHMRGRLYRDGDENKRSSFNIAPNITAQWQLSNNNQLRFQYVWRTSEPSFSQLNPVPDRTNPQHVIIGNPSLRTGLNHAGGLNYFGMLPKKEIMLSGGLSFQYYQDRVASNTVISYDPKGLLVQETRYENISGDYGLTGVYTMMIPLVKNKYLVDIGGNYSWNKNSFFADQMKRSSNTLNIAQNLSLHITPVEWVKLSPGISYTYEKNRYEGAFTSNEPVSNLTLKAQGNIMFFKTLILVGSFNQNFNNGYGGGVNENPTIINLSIENQFFKDRSGVLKLSVNDLLDQNISLSRSINTNSIIDRRENTIGRYLLLSYSQRIGKFK